MYKQEKNYEQRIGDMCWIKKSWPTHGIDLPPQLRGQSTGLVNQGSRVQISPGAKDLQLQALVNQVETMHDGHVQLRKNYRQLLTEESAQTNLHHGSQDNGQMLMKLRQKLCLISTFALENEKIQIPKFDQQCILFHTY